MADQKSIFEQLSQQISEAVADIREKVVEEPLYGRSVTERGDGPQWPQAQEPGPAFGSVTHSRDIGDIQPQDTLKSGPQWPQAEEPSRDNKEPKGPEPDIER